MRNHFFALDNLLFKVFIVLFLLSPSALVTGQSIAGTVWEDTNGNGIFDGGEVGLTGVDIELRDQFGTPVGINTSTDGVGNYTLTGGSVGTLYQVYFDIPSYDPNFKGCLTNQGSDPTIDSDMDQTTFSFGTFTLLGGGASDIDAGILLTVEIGDLVWLDKNGNGIDDDGSMSLSSSVDVTLEQEFPLGSGSWVTALDYLGDPMTNPISTISNYNFTDISPGKYRVVFGDGTSVGLYYTEIDALGGNDQASDVDNDSDASSIDGSTYEISLISGDPVFDFVDAGYFEPVLISGQLWQDGNADGIRDASEVVVLPFISTITVIDVIGGGTAMDIFNNPAIFNVPLNGLYEFSLASNNALPPGTYDLELDIATDWYVSQPDQTSDDLDSDFDPNSLLLFNQILIESGEIEQNIDGAIWKQIEVGGLIWDESSGHTCNSINDPTIPNIDLEIFDHNGDVVGQTTSDATGTYSFVVDPGIYDIYVIETNFNNGQLLFKKIPCSAGADPNNNIVVDNNGSGSMGGPAIAAGIELISGEEIGGTDFTENLTIYFGFKKDCNNVLTNTYEACYDAADDPVCDLGVFFNECGIMANQPATDGPNPLCPESGGVPHNINWVSFIAGYGDYDIDIDFISSNSGNDGAVQSGMYLYDPDNDTCWGEDSPWCENDCDLTKTAECEDLIPGNQYLIFLDGCNGGRYTYQFDLIGSYTPYYIPDVNSMLCNEGSICDPICPGTTIDFEVLDSPLTFDEVITLTYYWSLRDENGLILDDFINFGNEDWKKDVNTITYEFNDTGTYLICLDKIEHFCIGTSNPNECKTIVVYSYDDEDFGVIEMCQEDFAFYNVPHSVNDEGIITDPNGDGIEGWIDLGNPIQVGINTQTYINSEGCVFEQFFELKIFDSPEAENLGNQDLLIGEYTQLTPSTGGVWDNLNPLVATIDTSGLVHAVGEGCTNMTFINTLNGCVSNTLIICVTTGTTPVLLDDMICPGDSTTILNYNNYNFIVDDSSIVQITLIGTVIGLNPGLTDIFVSGPNGYLDTFNITVFDIPVATLTGPSTIMIGDSTSLSPTTGGDWASSNDLIATVTNTGLVEGISIGCADYIYTDSIGQCQSNIVSVCVTSDSIPSLEMDTICLFGFTSISLFQDYEFTINDSTIISIDTLGVITGLKVGSTEIFVSGLGGFLDTLKITILDKPTAVNTGTSIIIIGETTLLQPNSGGSWTSSYDTVATVTDQGEVLAISVGCSDFVFTDSTSNCESNIIELCVSLDTTPKLLIDTICMNTNAQIINYKDFTFTIEDSTIISIDTLGLITGDSIGGTLIYVSGVNGYLDTFEIAVLALPQAEVTGFDIIILGSNTTLSPTSGGVWTSSNVTVATATNQGIVTAIGAGCADFVFVDTLSGCQSEAVSVCVTTDSFPSLLLDTICLNVSTRILNFENYIFTIEDSLLIEIDSVGIITAVNPGETKIFVTGANGYMNELNLVVLDLPILTFTGPDNIFVGEMTLLNANVGGVWKSNDESIATIDNLGNINGLSGGTVSFVFTADNGCNSESEIITVVQPSSFILCGFAYIDENSNDTLDSGEEVLPNFKVTDNNTNIIYFTDASGGYSFELGNSSQSILVTSTYGLWIADSIVIDFEIFKDKTIQNIAFEVKEEMEEADLTLGAGMLRCNTFAELNMSAINSGNVPLSGLLQVTLDPTISYTEYSPQPIEEQGQTVTFEFKDLMPGQTFSPYIRIGVPPFFPSQDSLRFTAKVINSLGEDIVDKDYLDFIRCSYDPNDKRVYPDRPGEENYILAGETLEYTIRFQNNGNDTAFYVEVQDVIDPKLDIESIRLLESSHSMSTRIIKDTVFFIFENIMLVDSITNYEESQGYIVFSIETLEDLAIDDVIDNTADIIFDLNNPIITNTISNTVVDILPCYEVLNEITYIDFGLSGPLGANEYMWIDCENGDTVFISTDSHIFEPFNDGFYHLIYNGNECRNITDCVEFIYVNSIDLDFSNLVLYPNPTQDKLYLEVIGTKEVIEFYLYDVNGRVLTRKVLNFREGRQVIDVSVLNSGVYYLKSVDGAFGEKFVISR